MADEPEVVEPEVEEPIVEEVEPELDENGEPIEAAAEEEETEEVERDGKTYKIPKALKGELLMHADYTRKTQAVAEKERALDAAFQQHSQASAAEIQAHATVVAIDQAIADYNQVDWDAWENSEPVAAQKAWRQFQQLKDNRQAAINQHGQARTARLQIEQQETAKRKMEGQREILAAIPDFTPEKGATLASFAKTHYGFTQDELDDLADPRVVRALNDAFATVQAASKTKAATKVIAQQKVQPAVRVNGSASPVRPLSDNASTDAWMKARQKQLSAR